MGPFGSDIKKENFVDEGVPVIRGNNLTSEYFNDDGFVFLTDKKADELNFASAYRNDIIFTHRGTLGQVAIIPPNSKFERYIVSQSQMKCSLDESKVNPLYIYFFYQSHIGQSIIKMHSTKLGVPHIIKPLSTFKKLPIILPTLPEQNKMVDIFLNLDNIINSHSDYKSNLETLKKGLMKKLFIGEIRV